MLACYVVLFGLFELNILIFNFISFPVFNWIIIKFVYGQKTLSSVFLQCGNVSNYDIVRDGGCGGIFWN